MGKGLEELEAAREECMNYVPKEGVEPADYTNPGCKNYKKIPNLKAEGIFWCGICKNRTIGESLFDKKED